MTPPTAPSRRESGPDLSIVMPCYNEQAGVAPTIRRLVEAFDKGGYRLELVAVDNGSIDRTGEVLARLAEELPGMVCVRVERNVGYGNGILVGMQRATAPWIGTLPADGQVDAEDVVRLYEAVMDSDGWVLAKVRRRFRMDGLQRKLVSIGYNLLVRIMWPRLASLDVNGIPKLLPREAVKLMRLQSQGWFLDPEIMIKSYYMKLPILEMNIFARMRSRGLSHVRTSTCVEFLRELFRYRFSSEIGRWRDEFDRSERGTRALSGYSKSPSGGAPE